VKAKTIKPRAALRKRAKPAEPLTFDEWKQRVGVPALGTGYMRPRDWRTCSSAARHRSRWAV